MTDEQCALRISNLYIADFSRSDIFKKDRLVRISIPDFKKRFWNMLCDRSGIDGKSFTKELLKLAESNNLQTMQGKKVHKVGKYPNYQDMIIGFITRSLWEFLELMAKDFVIIGSFRYGLIVHESDAVIIVNRIVSAIGDNILLDKFSQ